MGATNAREQQAGSKAVFFGWRGGNWKRTVGQQTLNLVMGMCVMRCCVPPLSYRKAVCEGTGDLLEGK